MKQWMEMVDAPTDFQDRIHHLSNSLAVSVIVYEKYRAIFMDLFAPVLVDEPKKASKKTKYVKIIPLTIQQIIFVCFFFLIGQCALRTGSMKFVGIYLYVPRESIPKIPLIWLHRLICFCVVLIWFLRMQSPINEKIWLI